MLQQEQGTRVEINTIHAQTKLQGFAPRKLSQNLGECTLVRAYPLWVYQKCARQQALPKLHRLSLSLPIDRDRQTRQQPKDAFTDMTTPHLRYVLFWLVGRPASGRARTLVDAVDPLRVHLTEKLACERCTGCGGCAPVYVYDKSVSVVGGQLYQAETESVVRQATLSPGLALGQFHTDPTQDTTHRLFWPICHVFIFHVFGRHH